MESQEILSLSKDLTSDSLVSWSDEKKKEFVKTFDDRVKAAQYILVHTADNVWTKAVAKQFVPERHHSKLSRHEVRSDSYAMSISYGHEYTFGGRKTSELEAIAKERAESILEELPPLKQAVRLINPEISKMIEKRDALLEQGKKLLEEANELSGSMDIDDFPETTTLLEFKTAVKEREKKRSKILDKMDDVGNEGQALNKKIDKFLYMGLPGLSDAVIEVHNGLIERADALSSLFRRVSEQVQFGDSEAALTILAGFEKDELTVSDNVKAQFSKALEALKKAGQKQVKALKGK